MAAGDGEGWRITAVLLTVLGIAIAAAALALSLGEPPSSPRAAETAASPEAETPRAGEPRLPASVDVVHPTGPPRAPDAGAPARPVDEAAADGSAPEAGAGTAALAGYVHDAFRRPVVGAAVRVSRKVQKAFLDVANATTGGDGRFRLEGIADGPVVVEVRAPGFRPRLVEDLALVAGETREIEVALEPGQHLAGRVVDDTGEPVAGASVTAVPPAEDDSGDQVATSDGDGRFAFAEMGKGPYCLYARKDTYADAEACGVGPGAEATLRLVRPGALAGRVVRDVGHAPVPAFTVSLRRLSRGDTEMAGRVETVRSPAGEFRLGDLRPGTYTVSVATAEGLFAQREPVEVRPGETTGGLVFELAAAGRIAGTVVSASGGAPVAGATVELLLGGRFSRTAKARTDDAGRFEFDPVSAGRHRVNVEHPGFRSILLRSLRPEHLRGDPLVLRMTPQR